MVWSEGGPVAGEPTRAEVVENIWKRLTADPLPTRLEAEDAMTAAVAAKLGLSSETAAHIAWRVFIEMLDSAQDGPGAAERPFVAARHLFARYEYPGNRDAIIPGTDKTLRYFQRKAPDRFSPSQAQVDHTSATQRKIVAIEAGGYGPINSNSHSRFASGRRDGRPRAVANALAERFIQELDKLTPDSVIVQEEIARRPALILGREEVNYPNHGNIRTVGSREILGKGSRLGVKRGLAGATALVASSRRAFLVAALVISMVAGVVLVVIVRRSGGTESPLPSSFKFDGTLKILDKKAGQKTPEASAQVAVEDNVRLYLNLVNNSGRELPEMTIELRYEQPLADSNGSGTSGLFYVAVEPDPQHQYLVSHGDVHLKSFAGDYCLSRPTPGIAQISAKPGDVTASVAPSYVKTPNVSPRQNPSAYGTIVGQDTLATYRFSAVRPGGHIRANIPVDFEGDAYAPDTLEANAASFRTSPKGKWARVGTVSGGSRVHMLVTLNYGSCTPAQMQTEVRVKVDRHSGHYANVLAFAEGEGQDSNPQQIGQFNVNYPEVAGSTLRYVPGSTRLWAYDEKTCKARVVRRLPDGILGAGVDVGILVAYVPRDTCGGLLDTRFVTLDFKVGD